ncbi:MAG: pyridoxamine 5'-phosphate oxidase [Rickettsiales bacterium]
MQQKNHPFRKFSQWYEEAQASKSIDDASAMCLSTATPMGAPSSRIVLLKALDAEGFVFYTNMESRKSRELRANSAASLCFHWPPLGRQVRIEGHAEPVSDTEADMYFASRPRGSQIGAWASKQSEVLNDRQALKDAVATYEKKFDGQEVPRPPHWSGWRVVPTRIEFWEHRASRLHYREAHIRTVDDWDIALLYP